MMRITIVTGNPGKLRELEALASDKAEFSMKALDIPEIQSMDLQEIVRNKLQRAYDEIKGPVIVEDVSAGIDSLQGLPGPFIKFFEQKLGSDALYKLSKVKNDHVTITCVAGYYDGKTYAYGHGVLEGTTVAPRGKNGFGFDAVIVPEGHTKTVGEMTPEEKMKISHRSQAFRALLNELGMK